MQEIRAARAIIFPLLTNHILALWRYRSRSRRLCLNSLLSRTVRRNRYTRSFVL